MKVAYLTSRYPAVSHTFILREVQALRARGVTVETFSIRRATESDIAGEQARQESISTRWVLPTSLRRVFVALAWAFFTRPRSAFSTLLLAVRGIPLPERVRAMAYFVEAAILAHQLVRDKFDHLHCHFGNSGSTAGMLAAGLAGVPFSVTCHGSELREIRKHRLVEKVRRAAFVVCVSQQGRSELMFACPSSYWDKMHVIRCGLDARKDSPSKSASFKANTARNASETWISEPVPSEVKTQENRESGGSNPRHILCVGRLSREKGHLVLLRAISRLRSTKECPPLHCTLVGDGPMRKEIENEARSRNIADRITFTGSLSPDQVSRLYKVADIVTLASFSEGVPVVLMEALLHGRPVVATRVGGVPELVIDGQTGLLVPAGDPIALADAWFRLLIDPSLAETLACNGRQHVLRNFNANDSIGQLIELFQGARRPIAGRAVPWTPDDRTCKKPLTVHDF